MDIKNSELFKNQCYINGSWVNADNGSTSNIVNPANTKQLGTVPNCGSNETLKAIKAAKEAYKVWSKTDAKERSSVLKNLHRLMLEHQEDLARIITYEGGKPISESMGEIAYAASFFEWFSEEAKRVYGDVIPGHQQDRRTLVIKQPIGVVGCITPWNFPSAMLARKIAPAIAVGCTVVAKPAPETPYSATAMAYLSELAGIPKGVFNVVTGDAEKIGSVIGIQQVTENDQLLVITSDGNIVRMKVDEISVIGRNTQGVRLVGTGESNQVVSVENHFYWLHCCWKTVAQAIGRYRKKSFS